jgi:ribosomal protein S18 acetylase RimI-like enzyme
MSIRLATVEDATAIATIHVVAWQIAYKGLVADHILQNMSIERRAERWAERLAKNEDTIYVFVEDNVHVVGFLSIGVTRDQDLAEQPVGEIYAIYLHPDAWDKGYGRKLCEFACKELDYRGFNQATLWVLHNNERAQKFYQKFGFRPDGAEKDLVVDGDNQHVVRYHVRLRK